MIVTYENVTPSLIPNTIMRKRYYDGVHRQYTITPVEGYVVHDKDNDFTYPDPETFEIIPKLGFVSGEVSCGADYDFEENPREFYAVPENSVPADQIFGGGGNNDHEVM